MGRSWCADLPRVTIDRSDQPKRVTMIVPYYDNPQFFAKQLNSWLWYPDAIEPYVNFIVVDDGSPDHPLVDQLIGKARPRSMRVFRIHEDRRWNWIAARNIGAHHAADGWLLLTDMDHVVPAWTMASVVFGALWPDTIYGFSREEHTRRPIEPHKNSWLLTREMFWRVGGYDETFSGFYGSDGDWRRRCAAVAPMAILTDTLIRYEHVGDASTTRYKRKQPEDAAVHRIVKARQKNWTPKTLSFPYQEVTCSP